ncbi:putative membrane protein [Wickerhamomyces ciferrii]|uniref:Membrane protein n=1 Tax=Wickerhamomyces ciferrii (strain ATCC 14091 / BCRC 22168 / CBS 111 / JCM 3599 / NBRC 0793 / NRRL Y-1031 F-60-10) TaxID=1206466 RepID=K0KS56_WICCF|nr:uncharacterized protein BN7_3737 [Wickerhamomyces ciferrii]CCH44178.1 putative membrane protein [Wickerhamomyces ciferrii]
MSLQPNESNSSIIKINAKYISYAHTICASSAFLAALIVGVWLHYYKIVENGYYGYPDEWFPSVSATIGDRYPERSIFQILIALTSGPRFLLLLISYIRLYDSRRPNFGVFGVVCGIIRTVTCGGWVYITSTDDHDAHDVFMISYIVLTIPWEYYVISSTPSRTNLKKFRLYTSLTFFTTLIPLIYFFIQHKVHRVAGAYSIYAYFEWALIILDVLFDSWTALDFKDLTISLSSTKPLQFSIDQTEAPIISKEEINLKPKSKDDVPFLELLINSINSFIFWSVITSLLLTIWFFPLWNMGISGFELTILSFLLSFILIIPPIKQILNSFPQISRLITVILGVGAYKIEDPDSRLISVAIASSFASISLANEVYHYGQSNSNIRSKYYYTTFSIGLILSSLVKFANQTNNPIWPIMNESNGGWNKTGLVIGILAALLTPRVKPTSISINVEQKPAKTSLFFTGLGLGGLIFSLHAMLTDSSTIIIWNWEGYPIQGPIPVPHGAITLIFMIIGSYLGLSQSISTKLLSGLGIISSIILYLGTEWIGYIGGLGYILFLMISIPIILGNASKFQPGVIFTLGFLVHIILMLAHVWIVAYAFVPGGWILRERTDIILGSSTGLIVLGLLTTNISSFKKGINNALYKVKRILIILSILSVLIAYLRFPKQDPKPYHPNSKLITAGIWTIHFGLDNDMWASEGRMSSLIQDLELDVVGLLESDTQRIIMGNRDLTQKLGEDLNMYYDFGPGPNKHTWGCALLSKFPILNSTHHLLPSPVGELAPAIHATLDVYGEKVDVVVFHSGQEEDEEDRYLQSLGIRDIMGSSDRPLILLSYLVTTPKEGNYNLYVSKESGMYDIDSSDWDRWCEYILYKDLKRTGYARISRGTITDTELQVGKFQLLNKGDDVNYLNERINEVEVDEDLRFPNIFYGDGVRDHRFHVFDEPRYFQ